MFIIGSPSNKILLLLIMGVWQLPIKNLVHWIQIACLVFPRKENGGKLSSDYFALWVVWHYLIWLDMLPWNVMKTMPLTRLPHFVVAAKQNIYPFFTHNNIRGIRGMLHMVWERELKHSGLLGSNAFAYFVFTKDWVFALW